VTTSYLYRLTKLRRWPSRLLSIPFSDHQASPMVISDFYRLTRLRRWPSRTFIGSPGIVGDPSVLALIVPPAIRSGSQCFYAAKLRRWFLDLLRTLRFFLVSDLLANHDLIGSLGILGSCRSLSARLGHDLCHLVVEALAFGLIHNPYLVTAQKFFGYTIWLFITIWHYSALLDTFSNLLLSIWPCLVIYLEYGCQ
jgi:hypothetical protein